MRHLLANGAEAENAQRLTGERRGDAADALAVRPVLHDGGVGLGEVNSASRMFSAIDSRWVPPAQVRVRAGGRSDRASQVSTPAVRACAKRNFAMRARRRAGSEHRLGVGALRLGGVLVGQCLDRDAAGQVSRVMASR